MNRNAKGKKIRERYASDRIFNAAVIILSITTFIVIAYPLWFIVIASISNSNMVNQGKVILWPVDIRFYGYKIFRRKPRGLPLG